MLKYITDVMTNCSVSWMACWVVLEQPQESGTGLTALHICGRGRCLRVREGQEAHKAGVMNGCWAGTGGD